MKAKEILILTGAALMALPLFADRVDVVWINNVPSSLFDDPNWITGYAPGGEHDPTPNAYYAKLSGAHVDVSIDGAEGSLEPISI